MTEATQELLAEVDGFQRTVDGIVQGTRSSLRALHDSQDPDNGSSQ